MVYSGIALPENYRAVVTGSPVPRNTEKELSSVTRVRGRGQALSRGPIRSRAPLSRPCRSILCRKNLPDSKQ